MCMFSKSVLSANRIVTQIFEVVVDLPSIGSLGSDVADQINKYTHTDIDWQTDMDKIKEGMKGRDVRMRSRNYIKKVGSHNL